MQKAFGLNFREYIFAKMGGKNVNLRNLTFGGSTIYRAEGYLGNYIIVIPDKKLVAIRMISEDSHTGDQDSFLDFEQRVVKLSVTNGP